MLCIAGHGALDELAAQTLAQLLGKRGLKARILPHEAVSRTRIAALDVAGVAMMCISFTNVGGSTARLRYLLRRLRERQPAARLLLGLWPAQDMDLVDGDLRRTLSADFYVTSLREAVRTCLAEAHQAAPAADAACHRGAGSGLMRPGRRASPRFGRGNHGRYGNGTAVWLRKATRSATLC